LALMQQESTGESLGETARQAMSNLMEQKLPDAVEEQSQISTLVAEDKLEDALRQENAAAGNTTGTAAETVMPEGTENASMDGTGNSAVDPTEDNTGSVADGTSADSNVTKNTTDVTEATEQNTTQETTQDVTQTAESAVAETPTVEAVSQPTHYTIRRGDTLIGISLRNYGSNSKVSEICSLNGIADPDDIKIGQEILLP
jgi:nucleoid-associated protein YgaU